MESLRGDDLQQFVQRKREKNISKKIKKTLQHPPLQAKSGGVTDVARLGRGLNPDDGRLCVFIASNQK